MDLNRLDWSRAQDLLIKLVQILSPLAEREASVSFFLNKRFFIPPSMGDDTTFFRSRHPVRLLTTLHSVQKQVEEMIEGSREVPESPTEAKPAESNPVQQKQMGEKPEKTPPLSRQAKRLIDQVQDAIGKLCQSTHLKDPKEEPLREALKRLQPGIRRIIEEVAHEELHTADEGLPQFRFALPRSPRENILKKLIPFPENDESQKPKIRPHEIKRASDTDLVHNDLEKRPDKKSSEKKSSTSNPNQEVKTSPSTPVEKRQIQKPDSPPEKTSLPAVPFVSVSRQLTPARKKKKRKGFWFRGDEEERNNS